MSIFPDETIDIDTTVTETAELPLAKEYAWDFEARDFLLADGKNVIVTGRDAIKVWIWRALLTPKNRFKAYGPNYGNDLESVISQGLSSEALRSEVGRLLRESLLVNAYITGVQNLGIDIDGSRTSVSFTATTVYGEVDISV